MKDKSNNECVNCGHLLFNGEHYTRYYHDHGYPYTTMRCRAGHVVDGLTRKEGCTCENPQSKQQLERND